MEASLKGGFAQILSCCPKNLSCPKFGGAAASVALAARTPMIAVPSGFSPAAGATMIWYQTIVKSWQKHITPKRLTSPYVLRTMLGILADAAVQSEARKLFCDQASKILKNFQVTYILHIMLKENTLLKGNLCIYKCFIDVLLIFVRVFKRNWEMRPIWDR